MDDTAARNLERIAQLYERYKSGDLDSVCDAMADGAVWETEGEGLPWSGRFDCTGVRTYFARLAEFCEVRDYAIEKLIAGDDRVIALATITIRYRATGQEESFRKVDTFRLADGNIAEFREYYDTARVKAALGVA